MNCHTVPVSVVVPVWRNANLAAEAVATAFAQSFRPFEVILVDDASGDGTQAELRRLASSYPEGWVKVLSMPRNGGPGMARNLGMDNASGSYIAFLDADDLWHPRKTEMQYNWMEENPQVKITCTGVGDLRNKGSGNVVSGRFRRIRFFQQIFIRNAVATSSVILRASCQARFADHKRYAEDFLLWSNIMGKGGLVFRTPCELVFRRKAAFGHSGLSGDVDLMYLGALDAFERLRYDGIISLFSAYVAKAFASFRQLARLVRLNFRRKSP